MRVTILEPLASGHRFHYVGLLVDAFQDAESIKLVSSHEAMESVEYKTFLESRSERFTAIKATCKQAWNREYVNFLHRHIGKSGKDEDRVYLIPYADSANLPLNTFGRAFPGLFRKLKSKSIALFLRRGAFAYPGRNFNRRLRSRLALALSRIGPWNTIYDLDPLALHGNRSTVHANRIMPDPVEGFPFISKEEARCQLGLESGKTYIGMAGGIKRMKNVGLVIDSFSAISDEVSLILAGRPDQYSKERVSKLFVEKPEIWKRLYIDDDYFSLKRMHLWISAMDVLLTPYGSEHIGSSSLVIRAAKAGRPVLGSDQGWMGEMIPRFGLGWTCDVSSEEAFAVALEDALRTYPDWEPGEGSQRFCDFHSVDNFGKHWRYAVDQIMEGSSGERPLFWSEVAT